MGLFRKSRHNQVRQPRISDENTSYAFRRSRTMTGSLSSTVRAAAEPRADLQSDRLKHHTLRRRRRHLLLYLFLVALGVWVMVSLINQFMLSVTVQPVSGVVGADNVGYMRIVDTYFGSHPNERFAFSLRSGALLAELQKEYPEVKNVTVTAQPWLQAAKVVVSMRRPLASWTIGTTKYYIDDTGVAFKRNYFAEPTLVVEDKTGIDPQTSGKIVSDRMLHYIGRLIALLSANGYVVERLELPAATSREVDVRLVGKSYVIKTDLDRDPAGQVADIKNAVTFLESRNINPAYADVRVSSRLYYK